MSDEFYKSMDLILGGVELRKTRNINCISLEVEQDIERLTRSSSMTYKEIAQKVGVSVYTVQARSKRPKPLVDLLARAKASDKNGCPEALAALVVEYGLDA